MPPTDREDVAKHDSELLPAPADFRFGRGRGTLAKPVQGRGDLTGVRSERPTVDVGAPGGDESDDEH